ncbi:ABC transporter transmembrane domain-containing protein [Pediococcus acidilactici]|uniref:ABC transporter transmembrane domain-containing protein n=1 Tax=Pediococcus acidilactici TaxID=1254 RepID=UPI000FFE2A12|nr:ABC transporter ATP-binding protein [Pediococcus acidilactici]QAT20857.1 ABC transporter ATP-binding protein [Pediococcus acidilactici]
MQIKYKYFFKNRILFTVFLTILIILNVIISAFYPFTLKIIVDDVLMQHNIKMLGFFFLSIVLLIVFQLFVGFEINFLSSKWIQSVIFQIRNTLFAASLKKQDKSQKQVQTLEISDSDTVGQNLQKIFVGMISAIIAIVLYFSVMFQLNSFLTYIDLAIVPIFFLLNIKLSNLSKKYYIQVQTAKDNIVSCISDYFAGEIFIKMYHVVNDKLEEHTQANQNFRNNSVKFTTTLTFINSIASLLAVVTPFVIFAIGSKMVVSDKISSGTLIALFSYSSIIFSPVGQLVNLLPLIQQTSASLDRINSLIKVNSNPVEFINKKITKDGIPSIYVENICYSIANKNIFLNKNMHFDAPVVFLTGDNGSGKSTLSKIIAGLICPTAGLIQLNNVNSVLYLPSDDYLFKGTLLDNLTKGIETYNKEELKYLLKYLNFEREDLKLDLQLDNVTTKLSTGQIQKVKFVRSLLSKDKVVIFDEVLSNIDIQTRQKCYTLIQKYCVNKMFIVISHEAAINKFRDFKIKEIPL